jgi:DNA invertase Pin-like site-specific DNA recombinase
MEHSLNSSGSLSQDKKYPEFHSFKNNQQTSLFPDQLGSQSNRQYNQQSSLFPDQLGSQSNRTVFKFDQQQSLFPDQIGSHSNRQYSQQSMQSSLFPDQLGSQSVRSNSNFEQKPLHTSLFPDQLISQSVNLQSNQKSNQQLDNQSNQKTVSQSNINTDNSIQLIQQPLKVNINPNNTWSYYLEYNDKFDFTPGTINMYGYARVSTQLQAQFGSSVVTQIQLLYDECQRYQYDENNRKLKYNLMRIYVDDGISAKNIIDRPGLVQLKSHSSSLVTGRTHQKIGIIVSDLSRLTRSSADLEAIIKWVTEDTIKLKFIDNSIDPSTNAGKLMLSMMANFFEFERKNSSFKTRLTLRSMSENGTLTGHCSYGWTSGVDTNGRKINVPIPEEQQGLNEVIRISREHPEYTACDIKNIMNQSGIFCMRGPGRSFRGSKLTEKTLKKFDPTKWTGEWTIQIIEKIMEHDHFEERQKIVKLNTQSQPINIMKKDDLVIKIIKDHLEATDGYTKDTFNFSEIARLIDDKNIFQKPLNRTYVKEMMLASKIIKLEPIVAPLHTDEDILNVIRGLIVSEKINTYVRLTEILIEKSVPLIGKRKNWNKTNIRDLCIKYKIEL